MELTLLATSGNFGDPGPRRALWGESAGTVQYWVERSPLSKGGAGLRDRGVVDMPYVRCPGCSLVLYTAATYATRDMCPRCEAKLAPVMARARSPLQTAARVGLEIDGTAGRDGSD